MKPYKITVMGEDFLLFSQENSRGLCDVQCDLSNVIGLLPSIAADFSLIGYTKRKKTLSDYRAAAISAAAFLIIERGLPLTELLFETPLGNIEVFYTDSGLFEIRTQKCKHIITNSVEVMGCNTVCTDICSDSLFRVIYTENIKNFDLNILSRLVSIGERTPSAVVLYSAKDSEIDFRSYTDYNPSPPSAVSLFAAVSYAEFLRNHASEFRFGTSFCRLAYGGATVSLKPEIYKEEFT